MGKGGGCGGGEEVVLAVEVVVPMGSISNSDKRR